jgi:hypothetical protein
METAMSEATDQRDALMPMLAALDATPKALRRDKNGDPRINGKWGHIYSVPKIGALNLPGEYQIVVMHENLETGASEHWKTSQGWTYCKRAMSFAKVIQDGDMEGIFSLDRLPTPAEAGVIRAYVGIRQAIHLSEERKTELREKLAKNRRR